jgi:ABC-2 type transport system permease protein
MFYQIAILVVKELQALVRDRQGRVLLVMPVLLQLILFPNAATLEVKNDTLAIFNQDAGAESTELVQRFAQAAAFSKIRMVHTETEMRQVIDEQQAMLMLRFPAEFSRDIAAGRPAMLQAIIDGRRSNSGQIALGYVRQILQTYQVERGLGNLDLSPAELKVRHWFNPNLRYEWFIVQLGG